MRLIDRYLLRQMLGPTLLAVAALSAVAMLSTSLQALDYIVNQRQSALVFLKITLLYMPQLINMILPIAVFVAALVALNRLHTEQEIVVCFAGGMSRWRVISPAMRLAATIAFLALVMNLWIQPLSYRALRDELLKIKTDLAATIVREGEFTEPVPGLTVYAQTVDGTGEMHNLFIHQVRDNGRDVTYMANRGHVAQRNHQDALILQDGSIQEFSERGVLSTLFFTEYPFALSTLDTADELVHYKPSDRYLHELFFPDLQQGWEKKNRKSLLAEGHARIATPLYNIAFMALALWAIIGGGFSRLGYGRRMAIAFGVMTTTRVLGFVALSAAEHSVWVNALQYAIPLLTTWFCLSALFRQRVSRRIEMRRRPHRLAAAGAPA